MQEGTRLEVDQMVPALVRGKRLRMRGGLGKHHSGGAGQTLAAVARSDGAATPLLLQVLLVCYQLVIF